MPQQNYIKSLHFELYKIWLGRKNIHNYYFWVNTSNGEVRLGFVKKKKETGRNTNCEHFTPRNSSFQCFQMQAFLFKWIKGTLKAQKLWSDWVALSRKLSHDNEITVDSSWNCFHSMQHFLMWVPIITRHALKTIVTDNYTSLLWKELEGFKNTHKEILTTSHVMICDVMQNQNQGRTILQWTYLWNNGIQVKRPVTGECKNSYMLPQEYSFLLLNNKQKMLWS